MRSDHIPRPRRAWWRSPASVIAVAALAAATVATAPAAAAPRGSAAPTSAGTAVETHSVTLITGDVVLLQTAADGRQAAWLQQAADPAAAQPQIYEQNRHVHVIPVEAAPYLAAGVLDPNLFDVTSLVQQGFTDQDRPDLPLLVQSPAGQATPMAAPAGARTVRTLDSIHAVSVAADKTHVRGVWDSLRGPRPAAAGARTAKLATAGHVWLNARVHTTVQDGATQIGAPQAWAAGYNGRGVHVAVLDTGYDPTHPDLTGRVTTARNFTTDADPPGKTAVDGNGHGTHVAATIAGTGKAEGGRYAGVAPGADLWVGKVLDNNGNGPEDVIIAGMQWAADSGADVISMSLGSAFASDGTDPMSQAVNDLSRSSGALFVIAAGNAGPGEQTVSAPGAADLALTVGAVDSKDAAASFSSRGPRMGDDAIKPEVVAPGVDIVSARAAGTSEGNLLDRYYTTLSGTSMATPHVAGSAALLKQAHPDWTGDQLKAQLVATSRPLPGRPVTFQGAGRVDVAAAVRDSLAVDSAVLSLGHVAQDGGSVTRTVTYQNPANKPVQLRLSADVHGTGVDAKVRPDLSISRSTLRVPAHGKASTQVTLRPDRTDEGGYAGDIVATGGPGRPVHSVMSFAIDGPLRTVTVHAGDRTGKPASGYVDLFNEDTGRYDRVQLSAGTATAQVQDGTYTVMTTMYDQTFRPLAQTVAGDPQLVVDADKVLSYDARAGRLVTIDTPREADVDTWQAEWTRTVGDRSLSMWAAQGRTGQQLYVIPSAKARHGSFQFATQWQLMQPLLTATVSGGSGARVTPNPTLTSTGDVYVGSSTLPVVFAGAGTAADYAALDLHGKIALVTKGHDLIAQTLAAKDAGAVLLMVQNTEPGSSVSEVWRKGLPVYVLTDGAGNALRAQLSAHPGLTLDVKGIADASYAYELAFPETQLPAKPSYRADSTATVVSDYRLNSSRMATVESWVPYFDGGVGNAMAKRRNGPVVRTEYVSTRGVSWTRFGQPGEFANMYWTQSPVHQYRPGETGHQLWWGPLVGPGVPALGGTGATGTPVARFRDGIRISIPHYYYGDNVYGFIQNQEGDASQLELRRNGQVVGTSTWSVAQFTVPPERAAYDLSLSVQDGHGNFADTSTSTKSTWHFVSARSTGARTVLPLVELGYGLDADGRNAVPAGVTYPLTITPGYQPQATGPGRFTVTAQVSYDDGATWTNASVRSAHGRFQATMPAASPSAGFASVRVVATDHDGNRLTQEIDRAWRISG